MKSILDQLTDALANAEPNILGNRYATIEIDGNTYSAYSSKAGSHNSAASWGRIDYRMNGKRIAKAKLA
jgi:hypothetical protein